MNQLISLFSITRYVYVGIAFGFVCNSFYKSYEKFATEDVSRRQEYKTSEQRRYPSITFCYKHEHGTKHVVDNYLSKFVEKARHRGCCMDLIQTNGKVIQSLTGVQNESSCNSHCQTNPKCSLWTYYEGLCYLKNDETFLITTENHGIVSGMKDCNEKGFCSDEMLQNVKSRSMMEAGGWSTKGALDWDINYANRCGGSENFWAYASGSDVGYVNATFQGSGSGIIDFGNCHDHGMVYVYLNEKQIGKAGPNENSITINFTYKKEDTLKITEENVAILRINSLHLEGCQNCAMFGIDMYGGDIELIPTNDFKECRQKCNGMSRCKRWTHQPSKERTCLLKDERNEDKVVRADGKCGENFPLDDGTPARCKSSGDYYCCSQWGHCGSSDNHCKCEKCIDFRNTTWLTDKDNEQIYRPNIDVSFCHNCKTGFRGTDDIQCAAKGVFDSIKVDFTDMIPDRTSFLRKFTQRFKDEPFGVDVLNKNDYWTVFIANENSGPCYTYNPPHDSYPGYANSMYMVFNFIDWDPLLDIFIHEKNNFFYSKKRMLNTKLITPAMLNASKTKYPRAVVKISTKKKISTKRMPCKDDAEYNLFDCVENYYAKKRGCKYPWSSMNGPNVSICDKYSDLSPGILRFPNQNIDTGAGREKFKLSEFLLKHRKHCPPPCYQKKYSVEFEKWALFSDATPVSLQIALDSFTIYHEEEYYRCDSTCLLGQLGGNMGIFLGGSILMALDIIFSCTTRFADKYFEKRKK